MSDTPDESTEAIPAATPVVPVQQKPRRLNVVAAWVGIVAGAVVIVAVIFATGYMVGAHSGKHHGGGGGGYDRHHGNFEERRGGPPMWGPGPGGQGPGSQGPGGQSGPDGPRGPGQVPPPPAGSTAPAPPTR